MNLKEKNILTDEVFFKSLRQQFSQLETRVHDKTLVYLDNAATTLKPQCVVEAVTKYYAHETANIHRGIHYLSEYNTSLCEQVRDDIKFFLNAYQREEIIFTKGTTESLNLIARCYGDTFLKSGDEIVITALEHHSNIVPWQMLCERVGCLLKVIQIDETGLLDLKQAQELIGPKTKIVSLTYASNALGVVNPVNDVIALARHTDAIVVVDGAQAVAHFPIDVQKLDCDFFVFSSHKIFGPTGIGILFGKKERLEKMPPFFGGGDMIDRVTFEKTTYNVLPHKFEAGTPHIAGIIGLGQAINFVCRLGFDWIQKHESDILRVATEKLSEVARLKIIGTTPHKVSVISFVMDGLHAHDIGTLLDMDGIAIRTGHHCTQPLMATLGLQATARASFSVYNSLDEIDQLVKSLNKIRTMI